MRELCLRDDLASAWRGRDAFEAARLQQGRIAKQKDGRRTLRFEIAGRGYYLKYHGGVGWREIVKNILQLRLPVLGAAAEYRAALHLKAVRVSSLEPVGFGVQGWNPAALHSFLVTEDFGPLPNLETFCAQWRTLPPPWRMRRLLIERVATLVARMHSAGVNHRDLYLCHFLLDPDSVETARNAADIRLHIIDLHRAQIRARVPRRWLIKDLAALYFSARDIGLGKRDILRFLRAYFAGELSTILLQQQSLLGAVAERAGRFARPR